MTDNTAEVVAATPSIEEQAAQKKVLAKTRAEMRKKRKEEAKATATVATPAKNGKKAKGKKGKAEKEKKRIVGVRTQKSRTQFTFDLLAKNREKHYNDDKLMNKVREEFPGIDLPENWISMARTWFNGMVHRGEVDGPKVEKY